MSIKNTLRRLTPTFLLNLYGKIRQTAQTQLQDQNREIFFVLSSGSCGSAYLVELLKANGIAEVYHEKKPDFDVEGVQYYLDASNAEALEIAVKSTRATVWLESSNRLFAMTPVLKKVFPGAKFIHLHRDPKGIIKSTVNKTIWPDWFNSDRLRYSSRLAGDKSLTPFERTCHYWNNINRRILTDIASTSHMHLTFADLTAGKLEELEAFLGVELKTKTIPAVNTKDDIKREEEVYGSYENWSPEWQAAFDTICGPTEKELGYS